MKTDATGMRRAAASGVAWTALQTTGSRVVNAIVFVVLARLLVPEAFGVVALAGVFITFMTVFVEQGFGWALVQREHADEEHYNTAFWTALGMGCALAILTALLAPWIAYVFGEPQLGPVLRVLGASFVLTGLGCVPEAILRRAL